MAALATLALISWWISGPGLAAGEVGRSTRAALAAIGVAAAVVLPAQVAGRWLRRTRSSTVVVDGSAGRGGIGTLGAGAGGLAVMALAARFALPVFGKGWAAVALIGGVVVAGAVLAGARAGAELRSAPSLQAPGGQTPGGPIVGEAIVDELVELAGRVGLGGARFGLLDPVAGPGRPGPVPAPVAATPAACAIGWPPGGGVLVNRALLDAPPDLRRFVVAHELTHLARRHPLIQAGLEVAAATSALAAVPIVVALRPGLLGRPLDDPLAMPGAVLVVYVVAAAARLPVAWVLRALERSADIGAASLVGPPDRAGIRALLLGSGLDLAPPRPGRLFATHPTPAERAELLTRLRRAPARAH